MLIRLPLILIIISEDSYFLKMIMLFNFVGTLTQAKMGVGRITFPSEGSVQGQLSSLAQTMKFVETFSISIFSQTVSYFFKMITLISLGRYPYSNQNGYR